MPTATVLATAPSGVDFTLLRLGLDWPLAPGQGLTLAGGRIIRALRQSQSRMDFLLAAGDELAGQTALSFAAQPSAGFPSPPPGASLLIVSDGLSLAPALFAATHLPERCRVLCLHQCAAALPQPLCPSRILVHTLPAEAIATLPWFEQAGVPARLADPDGRAGCYEGCASALAQHWLRAGRAAIVWTMGSHQLLDEMAAVCRPYPGAIAYGLCEDEPAPRRLMTRN